MGGSLEVGDLDLRVEEYDLEWESFLWTYTINEVERFAI